MKSWTWHSSRRALGLLLLSLLALGFAGEAQAQARFSRVVLDTSPIAASGAGRYAESIKPLLVQGLSQSLQGMVVPGDKGAPVLVITVKSFQLAAYGGNDDPHFGFGTGSATDYLDASVSVQSGRTVLTTFPILVAQNASSGGPWFMPEESENRRVVLAGKALGFWIRKKVSDP